MIVKRPRSFLGRIERLETRTMLAGAEVIGEGESNSTPATPLHDPLQIAAPAYVRQMTITRPPQIQPLQPSRDRVNESSRPAAPGREIESDVLNRDQALKEWDQEPPRTGDTEDSETSTNEPPAASTDELDGTDGTVTDQTNYLSPETAPIPVQPIPRAARVKTDTSTAAMMTLVSPPQSTKSFPSGSLTTADLDAHVNYIDDDFHYFESTTSHVAISDLSLSSEPLSNHAARDTFMAMSMLTSSGTETKNHGLVKNSTNLGGSDSNPTNLVRNSRIANEPIALDHTHAMTPQPSPAPVRFASLPMVTLLHSVMFAGQMVLDSTAETIETNPSCDEPSPRGQCVGDHDTAIQTAMTFANQANTASETTSQASWRNSTLLTVVCASFSVHHSLTKRTKTRTSYLLGRFIR
ncbi:hypothetical protein RMSM_05868 [Rhodopirellula maiorica SM1]|uniref:Uncharacterized protein n=1 Tax=Rhodopirellula maiorica SM1 TaxID=1265738 RepID=M5RCJ7_9BACT|nr:hypothetical protein RMSM_05868 [Rhodopirellula maiorica SM1]